MSLPFATGQIPTAGDFNSLVPAASLADQSDPTKNAGMLNFSGVLGYVLGSIGARLRERVSVRDFPWKAAGDGVTDDTAAIQAADAIAFGAGKALTFPAGTFVMNANTTFASLVVMEPGAKIVSAGASYIVFSGGFDAPATFCLNVAGYVQFLKTPQALPQWFGAMGDAKYCNGSIASGSPTLTCVAPAGATTPGFTNGDTVFVRGAGIAGAILATTILTGAGTLVLTLATNASTTVVNAETSTRDNTISLQRFFGSMKGAANPGVYGASQPADTGTSKGYLSKGIYCAFASVSAYSGCVFEGEYGNTIGGALLIQCNISQPLITVIADNFDKTGASINGGSGNNIFRGVGFKSAKIDDTQLNAPIVNFQNAWNTHSDSEFDHCLFANTAGACIGAGFQTTGSITTGTTALVLANGSTLRNGNNPGGQITIKGAGAAGADLVTFIVSGGGTNNVVVNTAAGTTVAGVVVYPTNEALYPLKINDCEMDVCRSGIELSGAVSGQILINNLEAFEIVRGAIRNTSIGDIDIRVNAGCVFTGCGNPSNATVTYRRAIYMDTGGITVGSLTIADAVFKKLIDGAFTGGGPIYFQGRALGIVDNEITDSDSTDLAKFIFASAAHYKIKDNRLTTNLLASYVNARMIAISQTTNPVSFDVSGNVIVNTNASAIATMIQSDFTIQGGKAIDNEFIGNFTLAFDANISNLNNQLMPNMGYGPTQKAGTAAPAGGTYRVGDMVWNSGVTNAAGQAVGFVCVVAGTPGTWRSFGVTA